MSGATAAEGTRGTRSAAGGRRIKSPLNIKYDRKTQGGGGN